ncbi:RNA polymerase sigma factor [Algicella marina]|nr:sigma-70 family RNA polymerase sigma factor [Algicella marina]
MVASVRGDAREDRTLLDHQPVLYRYALSLTRAKAQADDLVQETFSRALQARQKGNEIRNPRAYLMRMLHNLHIDGVRGRKLDGEPEEEEAVAGGQEMQLTVQEVLAALESLPKSQRDLLWQVAVDGASYAEAANALGVPEGTVTSRLSRARSALKLRLGWDGGRVVS